MTNTDAADTPTARLALPRLTPLQSQAILIAGVIAGFGVISSASIIFSEEAPWVIFIPIALIALAFAGWVVRRAIAGSRAAIIAYLALIVFITDAQFRARGAGEIGTDWQSVLKFTLWMGAGIIGFVHTPPLRLLLSRPGSACWLIYIAIAIVSSIYAPTPIYSLGCALSLLSFFTFAFALITMLSERQFLWTVVGTLAVFLIAGWGVYYKDPNLGTSEFWTYSGIELRMCGLAGQANNLGSVCAKFLAAVFLLWRCGGCRLVVALPTAALGIATLQASDARTGMIAVTVGIGIAVLAQSFRSLIAAALLGITGFIAFLLLALRLDALGSHFSRSGDPTEVFTLTGRVEIWQFVWEKILEAPILGWGYNASKTLLPQHVDFQDGLMVDTAHNMLLQSLLSVGLLGTFPIVFVILYLFYNIIYRPSLFRDVYFVIVFVAGISDTSALGTTPTVLTLFFLMISIVPQAPTRRRLGGDLRRQRLISIPAVRDLYAGPRQ